MVYALIAGLLIVLAAFSGPLFIWSNKDAWIIRESRFLVSFSIGVFTMVSIGLLVDAFSGTHSVLALVLSAGIGIIFLEIASLFIPSTHHHHSIKHSHNHSFIDARRLLFVNGVHNVIDGMLLVPTFFIDIRIGIAATLAIFFHEIVKKMSEFFILKEADYSTLKALSTNIVVSSTIFIGILIGTFIVFDQTKYMSQFIAFAAGAFLYVIIRDLLPSTIKDAVRNKNIKYHTIAVLLGVTTMIGVGFLLPEVQSASVQPSAVTIHT